MTTIAHEAIDLMDRQGGSFVKALAECYLRADPINREKLVNTFDNYFDDYAQKAARARNQSRTA